MYLCHVIWWHRYIDDIMLIWQGPKQLLNEFVAKLNVNNFNQQFTLNSDSSRLEFWDSEIKKDKQGELSTSLFRKKTASNSFLHARSMHPPKCIEGIPKGQYLILRRICSSDEDFKQEVYKLYQRFKARGYKTRCLYEAYQNAYQNTLARNREDLFMYVGKTKRTLKRRIYEHIRDIKNCTLMSSIAKQIHCLHNGQYPGSLFQGIDRLHGDIRGGDLDNKLQLETSWIFRLNTHKSESGLNGHLNFQAFVNK
ncbi:hypothetical protein XELAEV_18003757mg [Xenopus laevis]|nr:hypothetical protein XELAEV_18003757mg [Xenopus laevis]